MNHLLYLIIFIQILHPLACYSKDNFPSEFLKYWAGSKDNHFSLWCDSKDFPDIVVLETGMQNKCTIGRSFPVFQFGLKPLQLQIHLIYRTSEINNNLRLILYDFDDKIKLISTDTIVLNQSTEWTECTKNIIFQGTSYVTISLEYENPDASQKHFVHLKAIDITENGNALLCDVKGYSVQPIQDSGVLPFDEFMRSYEIDSKILGIGETIHGTETLGSLALQIMKERILHHNCKAVLFEWPTEITLYINRYVKNDIRFSIEYIKDRFEYVNTSQSTIQFLEWIKKYNYLHNNEVSVYGLDQESSQPESANDLAEFVLLVSEEQTTFTNHLCEEILHPDTKTTTIYSLISDNSIFSQYLSKEEMALLSHCILNLLNKSNFNDLKNRDEAMADKANMILTSLLSQDASATIFMHNNHICVHPVKLLQKSFAYFHDFHNLGFYIKEKFGHQYHNIALTSTRGSALINNPSDCACNIQDAPKESIEYQMRRVREGISYLPTRNISDSCFYKIRNVGNTLTEMQFEYINPCVSLNGIILVDDVQPIRDKILNPDRVRAFINRRMQIYNNIRNK